MASVEGIQAAYDAAPSLIDSPGLALGAASSPDPQGSAELLGASAQYQGVSQAMQQFQNQQGAGMYSGLVQKTGTLVLLHDAGAALKVLNMPLQQVQHTYRYIRDVYHRHGLFAGIMETLGVAAGAVIGGAAGTLIGAPELGAVVGGELAGRLEAAVGYGDSWKATSNPHYMLNGHLVSPGRDLASLLGFKADKQGGYHGWGKFVSGLTDAGFDWYSDPLMIAGKARGLLKSDQGLRKAIEARWGYKDEQAITDSSNRVAQFMYRMAPGTGLDVHYPDAIATAYERGNTTGSMYSGVRRAVNWLAKQTPERMGEVHPEQVANAKSIIDARMSSLDEQIGAGASDAQLQELQAVRSRLEELDPKTLVAVGRIVGQFPELAPMAESLAKASNPQDVIGIFRNSLWNGEMVARMTRGSLPSRTLMRAGLQRIADKVKDQDLARKDEAGLAFTLKQGQLGSPSYGIGTGALTGKGLKAYASRKLRTFTGLAPYTLDRNTRDLAYEFDPKDPNAAEGILRSFKFGMGARTGEVWGAMMVHAAKTGDTALAKKIWAEGMLENLKAMGLPDDPEVVAYVTRKARHISMGEQSSEQYTVGHFGGDQTSKVRTASGTQDLGLYNYQRGYLAYPDFLKAKSAMRQMSAYTRIFGRLDDFAAEHYTNNFFKPLALITMGFGLRIALNEALIGSAKYGNPAYVRAMVSKKLAKYGYNNLLSGFHDAEYDEQVQILKAAAHALGGWGKFLGADEKRIELALRLIAENDGHMVKGVIASGHSGYGVPTDATGRASYDLHHAIQVDRGRYGFMHRGSSVPSGNYESIPFDHPNFRDLYLSALVRRLHEPSVNRIAQDLRVAMANSDTAAYNLQRGRDFYNHTNTPALPSGSPNLDVLSHRIAETDGGTVNLRDGSEPANGYVVSPYEEREKVITPQEWKKEKLDEFKARNKDLLDKPGHSLGWYRNDNGDIVLDVVITEPDRERAVQLANEHGQESIWDVAAGQTIVVNPEAAQARWEATHLHGAGEPPESGGGSAEEGPGVGGVAPRVVEPTEVLPAVRTEPAAGQRVRTDEQRIKDAFDYAVSRERKRIAGIDPETDVEFAPGRDPYLTERRTIARYLSQTPHEFANDRVDDILNLVVGRDGKFHSDLAAKIAAGKPITRADVERIPVESLPRKVAGQRLEPWMGPGLYQGLMQGMYKRLVDPVVNMLSREPLFFNAVEKHYDALQGAVEHGLIDDRDAFRFAQLRAMHEMLPMIHNTALRSQFGLMVRNIMPFYFAQEQAMKRAGNAILDSPSALRRWMLIENALTDPGFVHTDDSTGDRFLVFPGIGSLGEFGTNALSHLGIPVISGLPLTATGDLQSMQTVLPEIRMPSASPLVSLPLNWMTSFDPLLAPVTKDVLGDRGFKENILTSVVPNAPIRNAIMAMAGTDSFSSFSNAQLSALASAYYHGKLPSPEEYENNPFRAQQKIDEIKNNTRTLFAFKALLSLFSPLSPRVEGDFGIQQEWYKLLKQKNNVPGAALEVFLKEHGDKAIGFTVAKSENRVGAYIPYVQSVQQYLQQYRGAIESHPLAMAYLAPQSGATGDIQVIHDELMRMAVKDERTPRDFLEAIYQAQGERIWRASEQAYYNAKGNIQNPLLDQAWTQWQQQFRTWNPVAYNYVKSPDRATRALAIYSDLQNVFNKGIAPNTPQAAEVYQLMQGFDAHWQEMAGLMAARAKSAMYQLESTYHQQLVNLATVNPDLDSVIYNVFMHLDGVLTGNA